MEDKEKNKISYVSSIEKIKNEYIDLMNLNKGYSVFQSYDWMKHLENEYKKNRKLKILYRIGYLVLRDKENRVRVIFPFKRSRLGFFKKNISLLGDDCSYDYLDIIYCPNIKQDEIKDILNYIKNKYKNDYIDLNRIRNTSYTNLLLNDIELKKEINTSECYSIYIPPTYEEYISTIGKSTRTSIRYDLNRLKKSNVNIEIKIDINCKINEKLLKDIRKIFQLRKEEKYFKKSKLEKYLWQAKWKFIPYIDLNKNIYINEQNIFNIILLLNNEIAAYCIGGYNGNGILYATELAINPKWKDYSPGGILIMKGIEELINNHRNIVELDLTRGGEQYKKQYGGKMRFNYNYKIIF